ncbi:MAG: zinc ribbon domain-containing protein [Candidatus Marsarchaeota archaeon]|nr:zinc ribbon domain-containing protein [Candidatus Marsarchaeota archaeon]
MRVFLPILAILLFAVVISASTQNITYSVKLSYDGQELSQTGINLIEGVSLIRVIQPENGFEAKIMSISGATLYTTKFSIQIEPASSAPRDIFDENGTQIKYPEPVYSTQKTDYVLVLPYYEDAKSINIYSPSGNLMLSIDVSEYSKQTNPPSGNGQTNSSNAFFQFVPLVIGGALLLGGVIVFLVVGFVFYLRRKKAVEKTPETKEAVSSKLLTCKKCGITLKERTKFCAACGAKVISKKELACLKCNTPNEKSSKFCRNCGEGL